MTHHTSGPAAEPEDTQTEQAFYDRTTREITAASTNPASPEFLSSISEAAKLLRGNNTPAARGVHRAALDYLHTHALDEHPPQPPTAGEGAGMTVDPIPDEVFADAHLAAAAEVHTGTEWHAPINAAVRAALTTYVTNYQVTITSDGRMPTNPTPVADGRLLAMLYDLPSVMHTATQQHGGIDDTDEARGAFIAGCWLVIEAVTEWLTTHGVVQLPGITVNSRGEIVVEIDNGDQAVAAYPDDTDGRLIIETSQSTWNGPQAEQVALGILAVLRAHHAVSGGAR